MTDLLIPSIEMSKFKFKQWFLNKILFYVLNFLTHNLIVKWNKSIVWNNSFDSVYLNTCLNPYTATLDMSRATMIPP